MTRALCAALLLAVTSCATLPAPRPAAPTQASATPTIFTLTYTVPRFQGDSTFRCLPDSSRIAHPDSARLVGMARVKGWQWWPVGWYLPQRVTLDQHAIRPFAVRDTFHFSLPWGPSADSTITVGAMTHSRAGWSCGSNPVGATIQQ